MSSQIKTKLFCGIYLLVLSLAPALNAQTQFGESGLFYSPSAYAVLPGVFDYGIYSNKQVYNLKLECPSPLFFALGLAPGIESFVSFPDIFSLGRENNLSQHYGSLGLKIIVKYYKKSRLRLAATTYCRYLIDNNETWASKYLPGAIFHLSWISMDGEIFHIGVDGYKDATKKANLRYNFGSELFFYKELFVFYADSYLSPFRIRQKEKGWLGVIGVLQCFPHKIVRIEVGSGFELINNRGMLILHFGFTLSTGPNIKFALRKKRDDLPKPPPLMDLIQPTNSEMQKTTQKVTREKRR